MTRILFVCHGNICRSPMAEFVMKNMVEQMGLENEIYIESAATSTEEIGNGVYPPVKRLLFEHGINCDGKTARQITKQDYDKFDYIIGMDSANMRNMLRVFLEDKQGKLSLLKDYTDFPGDVADPWYTRDFKLTWNEVADGCRGLLQTIMTDFE